jgi:starch synthase
MLPNQDTINRTIKILYIASEAEPLVKIGGLGDVAGSLPHTLRSLSPEKINGYSLDVRIVIPYHKAVREKLQNPQPALSFSIPRLSGSVDVQTYYSYINKVPVSLLAGSPISPDSPVYSSQAQMDIEKYVFFSVAALKYVQEVKWSPHIIQANDWHSAAAVHALKVYRQSDPFFSKTRSVLSIHNLPYMGVDCESILSDYQIPADLDPRLPEWARRLPLPIGMSTADYIITVSPTYAQEIMTPEFGCGLDGFTRSRAESVAGIINGLNGDWNPISDTALPASFNLEKIDLRRINKQNLQNIFSLPVLDDVPLLILITRMDYQKGVDIAVDALRSISHLPWQAIILGTGDPVIENSCRHLETDFPNRVRAAIRFDARLARQMYGGADMLLMPSRYEPCGLTQMIAMRYGCVPVARATGGLKDTITDSNEDRTGFLFKPPSSLEMADCLDRAIKTYQDKITWKSIQTRGMQSNFGWEKSALEYAKIYLKLLDL